MIQIILNNDVDQLQFDEQLEKFEFGSEVV